MVQKNIMLFLCFWLSTVVFAQKEGDRLLFSAKLDHLLKSDLCTMINSGGEFIENQGWQATTVESQLFIELHEQLPFEGTFIVHAENFDPQNQNVRGKQQIIDLYSCECGDKDIFYTDGSWCNIRTGRRYLWLKNDSLAYFKFLAAPRGLDTRLEVRCFDAAHDWDPTHKYEFKITWNRNRILCFMDGTEYANLEFEGQIEPFKYIFIGKDNIIWGYGAQPGPIYSDIEIYGPRTTELEQKRLPHTLELLPAFPNPFNASTTIDYVLPKETRFTLAVFNLNGERVRLLDSGIRQEGRHRCLWDGKDDQNRSLSSGVYFIRLDSPDHTRVVKATLLQ